jgi:hypothetical protein
MFPEFSNFDSLSAGERPNLTPTLHKSNGKACTILKKKSRVKNDPALFARNDPHFQFLGFGQSG